jgi:arylsulfatase A-like enzyme
MMSMEMDQYRRPALAPLGLLRLALGLAMGCLLLKSCGTSTEALGPRPNLLFVVFDTTRVDHLSAYGYPKETSPRLTALAERGARFDAARSVSSLTPVSASSFLTGMLPPQTGVRSLFMHGQQSLSEEVTTLAERLSALDYATGGFVSAGPMGERYGLGRGFDVYDASVREGAKRLEKLKIGNAYQRRADDTTDAALAWLDGQLAEANAKRPFAMLVHYFDAHDAAKIPPREFLEPWVSFDLPPDLDEIAHLHNLFDGAEPGRGGPRKSDLIELYDAEIAYMDLQLGRILDELAAKGALENTLVVFLADHGESLGQHDFWTHGFMWDEQLHVPLILAGPGIPSGIAIPETVSLVDLVPTLISRGGPMGLSLGADEALDGRSFGALLSNRPGQDAFEQRPVISEVHNPVGDRTGRPPALFAVTAMPWKLIVEPGQTPKLFHLGDDPGELTDIYTEEHAAARALSAVLANSGSLKAASLPALEDLTEEERSMLSDLGYF